MPVTIRGAFTVEADRALVWSKLHDPDVLRRCLAEFEALDKVSDTDFRGTARLGFGPFNILFTGRIELQNVDPPHGWRMVGRGEGGLAGFARGIADVRLRDMPQGTAVAYTIEARIGGRMARLSGRLLDAIADRVAARFVNKFAAVLLAAPEPV